MVILNYINGAFVQAHSGEKLECINPATAEVFGSCPRSKKTDVEYAIEAAHVAFPHWSALSILKRADFLKKIANEIESRSEEFAQAESLDTGKPIEFTRNIDIPRCIKNFRFFADFCLSLPDESVEQEGFTHKVERKPLGVSVCISPWNLPLYLLTWKIAPALIFGNTVVAKPSEVTPLTAFLLSGVCEKVGLPKGVLNIVHGLGAEVGETLCTHPLVKAVSFTGSTETGRKISVSCAPFFKKVSLEMGGKNPCLIFDDVNVEKIIPEIARSIFSNQGQICLCSSRIVIHKSIYEEVKKGLTLEALKWKCGNPEHPETKSGALVSKEHFEKVMHCVQRAKKEGGVLLCGGARADLPGKNKNGYFITPTLFEGLPINCKTNQEEIFGPVAALIPFETDEEAIQIANSTSYGLSASVWINDDNRAQKISSALECGVVWINAWMKRDLRAPFGGVKNSGLGREGGLDGYRFFTEAKSITFESNKNGDKL